MLPCCNVFCMTNAMMIIIYKCPNPVEKTVSAQSWSVKNYILKTDLHFEIFCDEYTYNKDGSIYRILYFNVNE